MLQGIQWRIVRPGCVMVKKCIQRASSMLGPLQSAGRRVVLVGYAPNLGVNRRRLPESCQRHPQAIVGEKRRNKKCLVPQRQPRCTVQKRGRRASVRSLLQTFTLRGSTCSGGRAAAKSKQGRPQGSQCLPGVLGNALIFKPFATEYETPAPAPTPATASGIAFPLADRGFVVHPLGWGVKGAGSKNCERWGCRS